MWLCLDTLLEKLEQHKWLLTETPRLIQHVIGTVYNYNQYHTIPTGSTRSTLVIPGFSASNTSTFFLRTILNHRHHNTVEWCSNRNMGITDDVIATTISQVKQLVDSTAEPINIVGQSLGGCYARIVAREIPEYVNAVVTMGTPINSLSKVNPASIVRYDDIAGAVGSALTQFNEHHHMFYRNPDVPTTSIFSKTDGIIHHTASTIKETELSENIVVKSGHMAMGFDLDVIKILGNRLSIDKAIWVKFIDIA